MKLFIQSQPIRLPRIRGKEQNSYFVILHEIRPVFASGVQTVEHITKPGE
jgi:hypothetical protein